jgi:hypothetical protein
MVSEIIKECPTFVLHRTTAPAFRTTISYETLRSLTSSNNTPILFGSSSFPRAISHCGIQSFDIELILSNQHCISLLSYLDRKWDSMERSNHLASFLHMLIKAFSFGKGFLEVDFGQAICMSKTAESKSYWTYGLRSC